MNQEVTDVIGPEDLARTDARDLQFLVESRGYAEFFVPLIMGLMHRWTMQLLDPSMARHWKVSDDCLRGGVRACRAILAAPKEILADQEQRRRSEEEDQKATQRYEDIARGGRGPYGEEQAAISPTDPI
jgi:hypothetical protein